jgi:hypothetical protein
MSPKDSNTEEKTSSFEIIPESKLKDLPPLIWLVERMIPAGGFIIIYGDWGTGKTFVSLDLSFSVASGGQWLGNNTKQGSVIYTAAEGSGGLNSRVQVWRKHFKFYKKLPCGFIIRELPLLDRTLPDEFIKSVLAYDPHPALIILDTWARCISGWDENKFSDTSKAIAAVDKIRKETGAAVLVVHHSPKANKNTARGSGALEGAADTIFSLSKNGDTVTVKCEKQKEDAPFKSIKLRLNEVDTGDGIASCVVTKIGDANSTAPLNGIKLLMLNLFPSFELDGPTSGEWQNKFEVETGKSGATYFRERKELVEEGFVQISGDVSKMGARYTLTEKGRIAVTVK